MENETVKLDTLLKDYIAEINFDNDLVNITTMDLAKKTTEELNYWRFEVSQYLLKLQKDINKHRARYNWAERALKYYLGLKVKNGSFHGYAFEEKKIDAMNHDNYAKKLNELATKSKYVVDQAEFIPTKISILVDIAKDIIYTRNRESYHEN